MGRRRQRSRGGLSRRRFLVGGLLSLGGASLLGGTQAFSRVDATRAASIQTAGDENALLGVDAVGTVESGVGDQELVTLTNNTDRALDVTVSLDDPSQGNVSPPETTVASGSSATFSVSVASDSETGSDALAFTATGSDGDDFSVAATRTVDVTAGPELLRSVRDRSSSEPVQYIVQFDVNNLADFDRVEVSFQSQQANWASGTETVYSREGSASYSQWDRTGDTYEIAIDVYDTSGSVVLQETITDVANGDDPPENDDIGGENSSTLDSFLLEDNTSNGNVQFELEYEVSALDSFQHVEVTFDNLDQNWSDAEETNASEPTGTVSYSRWTDSNEYDITVDVIDQNGLIVDSGSITHTAGSPSTRSWPE